jgi:hypothetical protein
MSEITPLDTAQRILQLASESVHATEHLQNDECRIAAALIDSEARITSMQADLDYFRKQEKAGKRPFSTALTGKVIDGQLKRILEMEHTILDLMEQLSEQDNLRGAMFASTIEAHKKRIAELEVKANQFDTIERHLARRSALDGFASAGEKIAAMLHLCEQADPSGVLMKQQQEPV